jgi:hypothetical protein
LELQEMQPTDFADGVELHGERGHLPDVRARAGCTMECRAACHCNSGASVFVHEHQAADKPVSGGSNLPGYDGQHTKVMLGTLGALVARQRGQGTDVQALDQPSLMIEAAIDTHVALMCPNVCLTHNVGSDAQVASIDTAELPRPPEAAVVLMDPGPSGIVNDELPRPPDSTVRAVVRDSTVVASCHLAQT